MSSLLVLPESHLHKMPRCSTASCMLLMWWALQQGRNDHRKRPKISPLKPDFSLSVERKHFTGLSRNKWMSIESLRENLYAACERLSNFFASVFSDNLSPHTSQMHRLKGTGETKPYTVREDHACDQLRNMNIPKSWQDTFWSSETISWCSCEATLHDTWEAMADRWSPW